jgi:hypothetical protein
MGLVASDFSASIGEFRQGFLIQPVAPRAGYRDILGPSHDGSAYCRRG